MDLLTEEQILNREDLFIHFLSKIFEDYELDPSYTPLNIDLQISSVIMEYFVENFRETTLDEQNLEFITGFNFNESLYQEIRDAILDETVGDILAKVTKAGLNSRDTGKRHEDQKKKTIDVIKNKKSDNDVLYHKEKERILKLKHQSNLRKMAGTASNIDHHINKFIEHPVRSIIKPVAKGAWKITKALGRAVLGTNKNITPTKRKYRRVLA